MFRYKAVFLKLRAGCLKKTLLREKLCFSLLLISFLSCASAEKGIKLLPARSNVKPGRLQCQDCYVSSFLVTEILMCLDLQTYQRKLETCSSPLGKGHATIQNEAKTQIIMIIWKCEGLITHRCAGARPKDWPLEMCICYCAKAVPAADNRLRQTSAPKALRMFLLRLFKGIAAYIFKSSCSNT